ncbi:hypothetical protein F5X68DRAFT_200163 [Plectosphaerella plurivora]|uniref:F-box domain-containing protein n=1 Tax=Plectosphaerella plurivora TaxID=936078 RepID=A0A9P9AC21_9PEZI|nr:hypothetical protein F5X68DRAFT_200163 [Plectosphaerella plurivora]
MAGSHSSSPAPSESGLASGSESSHRCPNCCPEMREDDVQPEVVPRTVHLLDMPPELQLQIFFHLPNLASIAPLRLVCRQLNNVYQSNREGIKLHLRHQLTEPIREYYEILQRLKFDDDSIDYPPPGGWPNITPEIFAPYGKTDFALSVLRHLPYTRGGTDWNSLGYKTDGCDFSTCATSSDVEGHVRWVDWHEAWLEENRLEDEGGADISAIKHVVTLAMGHESGGIILLLDTFAGLIFEDEVRGDRRSVLSPREFCDMSRNRLERLEMVFRDHEENFELDYKEIEKYQGDHGKLHTMQGYDRAQTDADWEPVPEDDDDELDWHWIAHLYRKFGWPGKDYRREECKQAIEDFTTRWLDAVDALYVPDNA